MRIDSEEIRATIHAARDMPSLEEELAQRLEENLAISTEFRARELFKQKADARIRTNPWILAISCAINIALVIILVFVAQIGPHAVADAISTLAAWLIIAAVVIICVALLVTAK